MDSFVLLQPFCSSLIFEANCDLFIGISETLLIVKGGGLNAGPRLRMQASSLSFHLPPNPHSKINQEDGGADRDSMLWGSASNRSSLKSSFISPLRQIPSTRKQKCAVAAAPKFSMRVASKQAYICRDCGYIYNDRTPFEKLPDNYFCPVCGAPKRRFRPYEQSVTKNDNEFDVRKARKAQIQKDEAIGKVLPIAAAAVGIVALVGLYLYLNSVF
ncbi:uncharacterized protein LOC111429830 isoform X2 [Cucurbita moschata]|uniref:Uncharacterized protein LOC111429830 isoform X2 n=1 Tax=Cucurbita moschata TaxID=3662 RepID=A0A6J1E1X1_CUCMO|nr:uncharacterized protein LOC111429830 isoform X2 [Cucurbita moschata]